MSEASNKEKFTTLLRATNRNGVEMVIAGLEKLGFFEAPASSKHHLAENGGLLQHSLNVFNQAMALRTIEIGVRKDFEERLPVDSIVISSLLHDVCKAEIYKIEKKNRKRDDGKWEQYDAYVPHYEHCPMGHGEKSVIRLLRMGLSLTNDEILAIRWHMGNWDMADSPEARGNFNAACDKCPLVSVLMAADGLATRISESPIPPPPPPQQEQEKKATGTEVSESAESAEQLKA